MPHGPIIGLLLTPAQCVQTISACFFLLHLLSQMSQIILISLQLGVHVPSAESWVSYEVELWKFMIGLWLPSNFLSAHNSQFSMVYQISSHTSLIDI